MTAVKGKKKGKQESSVLDMMAGHVAKEEAKGASTEGLARVAELAQAQWDAAVKVAQLEDALKEAKNVLRKIAEEDLPALLDEVGIESFVTKTGLQIGIKKDVQCGILVANRERAYQWLADNGFGGLIKSELDIKFDRDHLEDAEKLAETLRSEGYDIDMSQTIHPQTLKAFVKERLADTEAEEPFPMELFGARPYNVATVKPRK